MVEEKADQVSRKMGCRKTVSATKPFSLTGLDNTNYGNRLTRKSVIQSVFLTPNTYTVTSIAYPKNQDDTNYGLRFISRFNPMPFLGAQETIYRSGAQIVLSLCRRRHPAFLGSSSTNDLDVRKIL
nr:hypothetical protein [Novosphingobium panipatense]